MPRRGELSTDRTHYWDGDLWGWEALWLRPDTVVEAVRQRFGRHVRTAEYLGDGCLNQSWRVDGGNGAAAETAYVLRVSRPELSREQIAYEHAFSTALHERVDLVVAPVRGDDGETVQTWDGWTLSLFPFVEGVLGTEVDPPTRSREAATVLARLHRVAVDELDLGQRPGLTTVDERPRWVWHDIEPVLRRELADDRRFDGLAEAIEHELTELDGWLDDLDATGRLRPRATVHGDFNPRNLLFRDDRIVGVIDFDGCRLDSIANEVAQVGFGAGDVDPRVFWRQYLDAGGPLADEDFDLLGGFARIGCLSELQWAVHDTGIRPEVFELLEEVVNGVRWLRTR